MPIVATAGHVDHGKTALIRALTGIDTDRLPEERARGMTTDLGFAHFEAPSFTVGVIDVPGHERYIRNMAAGAWGVDGAVFVAAADDGWMEQGARHAGLLRAFGVPVLAVALTKADLVPADRLEPLGREILARLEGEGSALAWDARLGPGWRPELIHLDCLRGIGVASLREALIRALELSFARAESDRGGEPGSALLYVDRVFTLRGEGLVVAGSLRGGELAVGDSLALLPAGEELRIRSLQRYGRDAPKAEAGTRVALSLPRPKTEPRRGDCLAAPRSGVIAMRSFYARVEFSGRDLKLRPGQVMEFAAGSAHAEARIWPCRARGYLRLAPDAALALSPGQPFALIRKGGADILGRGIVLAPGGGGLEERRRVEAALAALTPAAPEALLPAIFELALAGALRAPRGAGLAGLPGARYAGDWVFSDRRWSAVRSLYLEASRALGGLPLAAAPGLAGLEPEAARAALHSLESEGLIRLEGGKAFPPGELRIDPGPRGRAILARLEAAAPEGIDLEKEGEPGLRGELDRLCKLGEAVGLDGRLFLSMSSYLSSRAAVLAGREPGSTLAVGDAKAATGLSRKWIIPLLNRMERDALVKRAGELRVVLPHP